MIEIITNPITISVIVMCILCLLKLNVILSLLISALAAGLVAGMTPSSIMESIIAGLNGNGTNALAYLLLGIFAIALANIGLAEMLTNFILNIVKKKKVLLLVIFVLCGIICETIIPIHIAYIPILYPPLLLIMNKLKMDRRQVAIATEFGIVAPYITLPIGYGIIFQGIIADNMTLNGMPIDVANIWKYTIILFIGMIVGLITGCFFYSKERTYKDLTNENETYLSNSGNKISKDHIVSFIAIGALLFGQLYFDSMPLGAILGIVVLLLGGTIKLKDSDLVVSGGIELMGFTVMVMLIAGGYANVVRDTGAVDGLINAVIGLFGNSKLIFVLILLIIGLLITMGIGTAFGTIPVIAILYVPLCQKMGMSVGATTCLIACAASLGDAGSPASDSTLGPTAGLNVDGQHDHVRDTCIPTFAFYNIPLFLAGFVGGMIL